MKLNGSQQLSIMNRAVFLDRDGVLNKAVVRFGKPYPPLNLSELEIFDCVQEALDLLKKSGFLLIVITNQPDVARGIIAREDVEKINMAIRTQLPIDEIRTCYHDDDDFCNCRKPKPGALLAASEKFGIDLSKSYMIGDRWRDINAGRDAGCRTILIDYGYSERVPEKYNATAADLYEAAKIILKENKHGYD